MSGGCLKAITPNFVIPGFIELETSHTLDFYFLPNKCIQAWIDVLLAGLLFCLIPEYRIGHGHNLNHDFDSEID